MDPPTSFNLRHVKNVYTRPQKKFKNVSNVPHSTDLTDSRENSQFNFKYYS